MFKVQTWTDVLRMNDHRVVDTATQTTKRAHNLCGSKVQTGDARYPTSMVQCPNGVTGTYVVAYWEWLLHL